MYCPKCGSVNDDQTSFCHQCGAYLKSGTQEAEPVSNIMPGIVTYAGFWKRLAAFIIDELILGAAVSVLISVSWGAFAPVAIIAGWLYYALMESSNMQATVGKMALNIIVTDMYNGKLSFGRATGRYFGKILSGLILSIGYIMIAFTEKKQGLHDILAETLVVNK